jgi:hypothetical protein
MIRTSPWTARVAQLLLVLVVSAGCAVVPGATGGISRQPFADIPVPRTFLPYSNEWAMIQAGKVTAARLVYQTELPVEGAARLLETVLKDNGWSLQGVEPVSRAGFTGQALSFTKGEDSCRAEVVPSATTTRVDLIVARVTP